MWETIASRVSDHCRYSSLRISLFSCSAASVISAKILVASESKPTVVVGTVVGANNVAVAGDDANVAVLVGDAADVDVEDDADVDAAKRSSIQKL